MELLNRLFDIVITSIGGLILNLTANDLYERCPKAARWVLSCAVKRVREDQRERYQEEWAADILSECPTKIDQLRLACRIWWNARAVAREGAPARTRKVNMEFMLYGCISGVIGNGGNTYLDFKDGAPWGLCIIDLILSGGLLLALVIIIKMKIGGQGIEISD